jgi:hypothetical protein
MAINETAMITPPMLTGWASVAASAGVIVVMILINTLLLWGISKAFKLKRNSFVTAILAAISIGIVNLLIGLMQNPASIVLKLILGLVLTFIINTIAIKLFYKLKIESAMIIGATLTFATIAVSMILGIIITLAAVLIYGITA